jgi:hypothetical protein
MVKRIKHPQYFSKDHEIRSSFWWAVLMHTTVISVTVILLTPGISSYGCSDLLCIWFRYIWVILEYWTVCTLSITISSQWGAITHRHQGSTTHKILSNTFLLFLFIIFTLNSQPLRFKTKKNAGPICHFFCWPSLCLELNFYLIPCPYAEKFH